MIYPRATIMTYSYILVSIMALNEAEKRAHTLTNAKMEDDVKREEVLTLFSTQALR